MSDAAQACARRGKRKPEQDSNPLAHALGTPRVSPVTPPVARLGALDTPIPFSTALEEIYSPKGRLVPALRELVRY